MRAYMRARVISNFGKLSQNQIHITENTEFVLLHR